MCVRVQELPHSWFAIAGQAIVVELPIGYISWILLALS